MSAEIAIRCEKLSKTYVVRPQNFRGLLGTLFNVRFGGERLVEALKEVSFEVERGEVFGLIGSNGAGKSTLLSCIAGVTRLDSGLLTIHGHVDSILKIGVGFHPALTGRENVVIGAIANGVPAQEALACVDDVIAFAELEEFADMPFFTYSSGMQARLQFAVSVHRTPDILIIDEALATGDARFVKKSLRRIEELCTNGSTVLLVTHNLSLLEGLCHRALWLEGGQVVDIGPPQMLAQRYLSAAAQSDANTLAIEQEENAADSGTGEITIESVAVNSADEGEAVWNEPLEISVIVNASSRIENPAFRLLFFTARDDKVVAAFWNVHATAFGELRRTELGVLDGRCRLLFRIPHCPFGRNSYYFSFTLSPAEAETQRGEELLPYVHRPRAAFFRVSSFPKVAWDSGRSVVLELCVDIRVEASHASAVVQETV